MSKEPEWQQFRVGKPSAHPNRFEPDCCPLDLVYHIAHVKDAIRIIEDGRIRSGLIYDESCLNTKRTCVSWASPNYWHDGSIYGNVQFIFDWESLVKGKRFYWVEHLRTGRQRIVRLLICEEEFTDEKLTPYDPAKGDGPLYYDRKRHRWYFNEPLTNEYMVLVDLPLSSCAGISFCNHHPRICKKKFEPCDEKGLKDSEAGAVVLGRLIGIGSRKWARLFEWHGKPGDLDPCAESGLEVLCRTLLAAHNVAAKTKPSAGKARSIVASMCLAASFGKVQRVKNLANLLPSKKDIEETFWQCAQRFFKGLKVRTS